MNDAPNQTTANPLPMSDPRRAGTKAAVLWRLGARLKITSEFSEPGHADWKRQAHRHALLKELIAEVEGMPDVT